MAHDTDSDATITPRVQQTESAGKAYQSVAQSAAIAIQDATDSLRNLSTMADTAVGAALDQLPASGEYSDTIDEAGAAMQAMHGRHAMHDAQAMSADTHCTTTETGQVVEFQLAWPGAAATHAGPACHPTGGGSTHEIVWNRAKDGQHLWISGQNYNCLARVDLEGNAIFHAMPEKSLPHGLAFDANGDLWVTFEGLGQLARIDNGAVARTIDVRLYARGGPDGGMNTRPHGLALASDGALWFTGKLTNTVGRVFQGAVQHFQLPTMGAVPIYLGAGADGSMWCTELTGSMIAHVTAAGQVTEFAIPTANSRPIAIVPAPDGTSMWFSEEAGARVARIDTTGTITEFPVPLSRSTAILGALAFDSDGALWTQSYCPPPADPEAPTGDDYILRMGPELLDAPAGDLSTVPVTFYKAPSRRTVMHRIVQGPDGNIWFTELGLNQVGRVVP